jgi:hypothetical protein
VARTTLPAVDVSAALGTPELPQVAADVRP